MRAIIKTVTMPMYCDTPKVFFKILFVALDLAIRSTRYATQCMLSKQ